MARQAEIRFRIFCTKKPASTQRGYAFVPGSELNYPWWRLELFALWRFGGGKGCMGSGSGGRVSRCSWVREEGGKKRKRVEIADMFNTEPNSYWHSYFSQYVKYTQFCLLPPVQCVHKRQFCVFSAVIKQTNQVVSIKLDGISMFSFSSLFSVKGPKSCEQLWPRQALPEDSSRCHHIKHLPGQPRATDMA